jgi:lysophospholipase L1-like esterase
MTHRRLAIAALAVPLLAAACVSNETIGTRAAPPVIDPMFQSYVAIGTSIGAGIVSGGLDSVGQKGAYPYLLATAMGLTPGVDWHWPKIGGAGCPAPYTNIVTGTRGSTVACGYRDPESAYGFVNNVSIPSLRLSQVENIWRLDFPSTDVLSLAQFITGGVNPLDMALRAQPTFVTLEVAMNDVLGAATRGDTMLLTRADSFQAQFTRIADKLDDSGAKVAVANAAYPTRAPRYSMAAILFCLRNGGCPAGFPPATLPFSLATFTVDATCSPASAGLTTLVPFDATARIVAALSASGSASLNCGTGVVKAPGALANADTLTVTTTAELAAIRARVDAYNAVITAQATARGWALVDLDAMFAAQAAQVPLFPNLAAYPTITTPTTVPDTLFGVLFSQDGVHPTAAGQKVVANAFRTAINAKFGTTLPAIP